jgi:ferredoxin-NADP reductase
MEEVVKIIRIRQVTHNVKQFRLVKPEGYEFIPGQATELSINKPGWKEEKRPFTFTSLNDDPFLEFTIKIYKDHPGVTNKLDSLIEGDELVIRDVWGAITYQGEGYFIAGGAGITPFLAILRELREKNSLGNNKLFFSNRTRADIIMKDELQEMLGKNVVFTLTQDSSEEFETRRIDERFLKDYIEDFTKHFYICGPDPMMTDLRHILTNFGTIPDAVVFEK